MAPVFAEERRQLILSHVREAGKATVEELAQRFDVSLPTIRADLGRLESQGLLRRTHGGALPVESTLYEAPYRVRAQAYLTEKRSVAEVCASLVSDDETVLLDAGTTTFEIAVRLKRRQGLKLVTNSLSIAWEMMDHPSIGVILLGGQVTPDRRATLGDLVLHTLAEIRVDISFVSFNGVHAEAGYTSVDFDAASIKRSMMDRARQVVVAADHSKLGQVAFARVGPVESGHILVVDAGARHELLEPFHRRGVDVRIAPL